MRIKVEAPVSTGFHDGRRRPVVHIPKAPISREVGSTTHEKDTPLPLPLDRAQGRFLNIRV